MQNPKVPCCVISLAAKEAFEIDKVKVIPWQRYLEQHLKTIF